MSGNPDDNVCEIALESAVAKAREMCGDREFEDVTSAFFGLDPDTAQPCEMVLGGGIGPNSSMREVRRWTHCRASQLVEEQEMSFEEATAQAWDEAEGHTAPLEETAEMDDGPEDDLSSLDDMLDEDGDLFEEDDEDSITMDDSEFDISDSPLDG